MADGTDFGGWVQEASNTSRRPSRPPNKPLELMLYDLWSGLLGRSEINVDDCFHELGGDPGNAAHMLAATSELIQRPIPAGKWRERLTIRNLCKAIVEEAQKDPSLVTCARVGEGRPFFFCHGDFSSRGFYAAVMARSLGGRRPVYLLNPAYKLDSADSIEQMAEAYVDEITRLQPTGPIDLGGFCNGGVVAWAVAHQLAVRGRAVNRLVLVDSCTLNARRPYRAAAWLVGRRRTEVMSKLWLATEKYRYRRSRLFIEMLKIVSVEMLKIIAGRPAKHEPPLSHVEAAVLHALAPYLLPRLPCHVDAILSHEGAGQFDVRTRPLRHLIPSLENHLVPGLHQTCITTYVGALAEVLTRILESPTRQERQPGACPSHSAPISRIQASVSAKPLSSRVGT